MLDSKNFKYLVLAPPLISFHIDGAHDIKGHIGNNQEQQNAKLVKQTDVDIPRA